MQPANADKHADRAKEQVLAAVGECASRACQAASGLLRRCNCLTASCSGRPSRPLRASCWRCRVPCQAAAHVNVCPPRSVQCRSECKCCGVHVPPGDMGGTSRDVLSREVWGQPGTSSQGLPVWGTYWGWTGVGPVQKCFTSIREPVCEHRTAQKCTQQYFACVPSWDVPAGTSPGHDGPPVQARFPALCE